jgi:Mor family transcriptional regulator
MGSKFEFDQTRNAIGVENLSNDERKAMLDKFKSGGGKILSEKELKEKKRKEAQERQMSQGRGSSGGRSRYLDYGDESSSVNASKEIKTGTLAKFFLKLKTFFDGLTPFGTDSIKPAFFEFFGLDIKQAIVEFNLIGNDLFLQSRETGKKISANLDEKNPILMELLQRMHSLFDSKDFNRLLEFHHNNPGSNVPFKTVEEPIKLIYKKLYYLYPYQETVKKAITMAVEIYNKEVKDENNKNLMEQKKKKFIKDINIVFSKGFPKLFSLICRMDLMEYLPFSPSLEKAISVIQDEKIGKRKKGETGTLASSVGFASDDSGEIVDEPEEDTGLTESDTESEENTAEEELNQIKDTKEYQYGMKLMKQYSLPQLRKKFDPQNKFSSLQNNDRALLAYLYFLEFDKELSFVLTTKKIKLSPDYSTGTKKDYKQILADTFNQSRSVMQAFENYSEARETFESFNKPSQGGSYIEASKRKEQAKTKMDTAGRNVRGLVRSYMESVTRILAVLITDMKSTKAIVENMDEAVEFDSDLEGSKRLNKQAVKQCILEAYCYSLALNERLLNGDLFGGILEMTDEEMIQVFGSNYKDNPA